MKRDFRLSSYDFHLPNNQIAQFPSDRREEARLLILDRATKKLEHRRFRDIIHYVTAGDCIVINKTKVFPARLIGRKPTGGKIEFLLLHLPQNIGRHVYESEALCKSSKPPRIGQLIEITEDLSVEIIHKADSGRLKLHLFSKRDILEVLEEKGLMPLPPYIKRDTTDADRDRYQTIYAEIPGSVAAPTAGLHFTKEILECLQNKGVSIAPITLHVGYGTFAPIRSEDIRRHKIHSEWIEIGEESVTTIKKTRRKGGRIICTGTTSVRALEFVCKKFGELRVFSGNCDLYIYPGFKFKATDAMLTNFHLPKSSLLLLVSAFAGRKLIIDTYEKAVKMGYRFFSYGDAMFIL